MSPIANAKWFSVAERAEGLLESQCWTNTSILVDVMSNRRRLAETDVREDTTYGVRTQLGG